MFDLSENLKSEILLRTQIIKLYNAGFLDKKETDMFINRLMNPALYLEIAEFLEFLTRIEKGNLIKEVRESLLDSSFDIKFFDENGKEIPKNKLNRKNIKKI